jgi:hypothetical protein
VESIAVTLHKRLKDSTRRKTAKQCRERWRIHLNPGIVDKSWSSDEQLTLLTAYQKLGNKWAKIAKNLPGRTDNGVKNYFFCRLRKVARCIKNRVVDLSLNHSLDEARQFAYFLNHLYTYYIFPDCSNNYARPLNPKTIKRENQGDKYILDLIKLEPQIRYKFKKYVELFLARLSEETLKTILQEYPHFNSKLPIELNNKANNSKGDRIIRRVRIQRVVYQI